MNQVTEIANYQPVYIRAPFLEKSKTEIIRLGLSLGLDYSKAWSCYKGEDIACGVCGTCQERLEAFATLGKEDPIAYKQTQLVEKKKK
jgi:7-cyano-7-deazaguanine synthase